MSEGTVSPVEHEAEETRQLAGAVVHAEPRGALEPAPVFLPGEVKPHPTPFKYVMIAVVLCVATGLEVSVSYMEGDIPDGLIVVLLLAMMVMKFFLVASWFMHLRTDQPVFKRLFVLGSIAAPLLYLIVLATLHGVLG